MAKNVLNWNLRDIIGKGYKRFWEHPGRYVVVKGSRGSKKSYTAALWHIYNMMLNHNTNTLIVRKTGATLRDSVFSQLKVAIDRLEVGHLWKATVSPLEMTYIPTGQKILFRGMDEASKITSITVSKGYLTYVFFEEAFEITDEMEFEKINFSIRGYRPEGTSNRLTICFNPWNEGHWLNEKFFKDKPLGMEDLEAKGMTIHEDNDLELVMTTNYKTNEFLSEQDIQQFERMKLINPKRYAIEGMGNWGIATGLVFDNWSVKNFDPQKLIEENKKLQLRIGLDWGYVNDPTGLLVSLVDLENLKIYIFEEHYETGMSNKQIAAMIKARGYQGHRIYCDSAEQKSIDELKSLGIINAKATIKGAGSVLYGVQYIQNFEIIIHPRCPNAAMEASLYCWSKDKDANLMNKPIDKWNHLISDCLRYSLNDLISKKKGKIIDINSIL